MMVDTCNDRSMLGYSELLFDAEESDERHRAFLVFVSGEESFECLSLLHDVSLEVIELAGELEGLVG